MHSVPIKNIVYYCVTALNDSGHRENIVLYAVFTPQLTNPKLCRCRVEIILRVVVGCKTIHLLLTFSSAPPPFCLNVHSCTCIHFNLISDLL